MKVAAGIHPRRALRLSCILCVSWFPLRYQIRVHSHPFAVPLCFVFLAFFTANLRFRGHALPSHRDVNSVHLFTKFSCKSAAMRHPRREGQNTMKNRHLLVAAQTALLLFTVATATRLRAQPTNA